MAKIKINANTLGSWQQKTRLFNKHKILEAAAQVFKQYGFNGACI